MSHDPYEAARAVPEFDEILQLQIDEFVTAIGRATQGKMIAVIVQTDKATQIGVHTTGPDRQKAKAESIMELCITAAGALSQTTNGSMSLMIRFPDGSMSPALDKDVKAYMGEHL